ncbi:MAG: hypothetical protein ACYC75_03180 [Minisyncoccota bacterium]
MTSKKIGISIASLATVATMLFSALPVSAQTISASLSVSAQVAANATARLATVIARGNADIAARITALNNLNARVQEIKNESATEKANIASQVQTNIANLTTLQTKIDADTDITTARSDDKTIFTTYRIYALVMPQGWILASADRVTTVTGLMTDLVAKIQARITADQTAGKNVTSFTTALADMNAKIADANTQSASAQSGVSTLVPDQGSTTVAASNKAALVAARGDIRAATTDLKAARADIRIILQGLKSLGVSASASASASTTAGY